MNHFNKLQNIFIKENLKCLYKKPEKRKEKKGKEEEKPTEQICSFLSNFKRKYLRKNTAIRKKKHYGATKL